jgi:hypothetical protein
MTVQIQLRHDTAANWSAVNPVLAVGEAGVEIDTNKMKFGTGAASWSALPYLTGSGGGSGVPTTTRVDTTLPLSGGGDLSTNRNLTILPFVGSAPGAVPASPGGSTSFLRADGTWSAPGTYTDEQARDAIGAALVAGANVTISVNDAGDTITISATGTGGGGGAVADGSYTDIVVSGSGAVWNIVANAVGTAEIANGAVTAVKLANMAANTLRGNNTGSPFPPLDLSPSQAKTLLAITEADVTGLTADLTAKADKATTIPVTAPITGGGTLGTPTALGITDFTTTSRGAVPNPTATSGRFLKDDGTWSLPNSGASGAGNVFPFTYNTSIIESITGSQLRGNNSTFSASTKLWISEVTVDGLDVTVGLGRIKAGFQVYIQDYTSAARYALFSATADSIDKGAYWEISVTPVSSLGTIPGGKVALQTLSTAQSNTLFSTTSTAAGLTPGSSGASANFLRGDGTWAVAGDMLLGTPQTVTGTKTFGVAGNDQKLAIAGQTSGSVTLKAQNAAAGILILPNGGDTVVGRATTDTLTNKTIAYASNTITGVPAALNGLTGVWKGTQAQYNAIVTKDSNVLYAIMP